MARKQSLAPGDQARLGRKMFNTDELYRDTAIPATTYNGRSHSVSLPDRVAEALGAVDLDALLGDQKGFFGDFLGELFTSLDRAFVDRDDRALFDVHMALQRLYEEQVAPVRPGAGHNQYHPFVIRVRNEIERRWERFELQRASLPEGQVPARSDEFLDFLRGLCAEHRLASHPLFDYLEREASREEIVEFFLHEGPIALRFCDLVVLSMVGAHDEVRRELADNFWDEVGSGDYSKRHTELYRRLMRYVGRELPPSHGLPDTCLERLDWRGLAGYNAYFYLALHRRNYFRSVGCLGVAEMMDPAQYEKIVRGCYRVGLTDDYQLAYYVDHVTIDKEHGDGWFDHVMAPLVTKYPESTYDMAVGALLRMNTGAEYYDGLLEKLPRIAAAEIATPQRRAA